MKEYDSMCEVIHNARNTFMKNTGEFEILEIKVSPKAFNRLVCSAHKKANFIYGFDPSGIHNFQIMGVKISPKFERANE